jgi:hypothetical protein
LFAKVVPLAAMSALTFAMTRIDSTVWSSDMTRTMFGLAAGASAFGAARAEPRPATSATATMTPVIVRPIADLIPVESPKVL